MCGITGGWWLEPFVSLEKRINVALDDLYSRGPNDSGVEFFPSNSETVALAQTRLSIIDLSAAGHQPMFSADKRYVLVLNGEIYNYRELRKKLEALGYEFVSDSDTEVLLSAWIQWGESCLKELEGMFAFVIYDRQLRILTCVRDAFGIKPFFYTLNEKRFIFASEQGALIGLMAEKLEVNLQRSYDYLVHAEYDSQEQTFIDGVLHLLPGHLLQLDLGRVYLSEIRCWWEPDIHNTSNLSFDQAVEAVRERFLHNIRLHLRSDVPIGAALSGGIDSSAVVCGIRYVEPDADIETFSYIASGHSSEEKWVDTVNRFVRSKPHKVMVTAEELLRDLDSLIKSQGEPFANTSIYAQYRVFQMARENGITVMLDGQGADEVLAGYDGYPGYRLLSLIEQFKLLDAYRFARDWGQWPGRKSNLAWMWLGRILLPDYLYRNSRKLLDRDFSPSWLDADLLIDLGVVMTESRSPMDSGGSGRRVVERLSKALQKRGLPSLLRHADRNSMNFSIESRVPFLTLPMVEMLLSLPENYLISDTGETKCVFRAAMRGIVSDEILDRKDKIGFATPERDWLIFLAPKLRDWLLASDDIPFLNRDELLKMFDLYVAGKIPFTWQLWRWVNYVKWYSNTIV